MLIESLDLAVIVFRQGKPGLHLFVELRDLAWMRLRRGPPLFADADARLRRSLPQAVYAAAVEDGRRLDVDQALILADSLAGSGLRF